jgi:hypothetical protein
MGQLCFGRSRQHRPLIEDVEGQESKLKKALLVLAEIAKTHELRQQEINKEMQQNSRKVEQLLLEYAQGKRDRQDVQRQASTLEVKNRLLGERLKRVTHHYINTKQQEQDVEEFFSSLSTSRKMLQVVNELGSIGFNVESMDRMTDRMDDMMGNIREVTSTHNDFVSDSNSIDTREFDTDAMAHIAAQLDKVDDYKAHGMLSEFEDLQLSVKANEVVVAPAMATNTSSSSSKGRGGPVGGAASQEGEKTKLMASVGSVRPPTHTIGGLQLINEQKEEEEEDEDEGEGEVMEFDSAKEYKPVTGSGIIKMNPFDDMS